MKNIINLLRYNFGKYYISKSVIFYIIGLVFLLLNSIGFLTKIPIVSQIISLLNVAFIVTFLAINLIWSIVRFQAQISNEKGKLLFTFPIKSSEFIISKIIEFIIIQGGVLIVAYVISLISTYDIAKLINISSTAVMFGTTVAYILIISLIIVFSSYINNKALSMIAVLIGGSIIQGIVGGAIKIVTNLLPYIYIRIGTFIEIDVIYTILSSLWIIFIVWVAIYYLDKKLDII